MGGEQTRSGKHLYFCVAYLIFLFLSGCAALWKDIKNRVEARGSLLRSEQYLARGDYEAALKENEWVLSLSGNRPPADEALFNLGLIYAHYENPRRDWEKSLGFFRRLVGRYPGSSLVDQAKIWVGILEGNRGINEKLEKLHRVIEESKGENQKLSEEIEKTKEENQRLNEEISELIRVIKKSRQVDVEVERKKRGEAR